MTTTDPEIRAVEEANATMLNARGDTNERALRLASPNARVVRIPGANHIIFISHKIEVLHEIRAFVSDLPR